MQTFKMFLAAFLVTFVGSNRAMNDEALRKVIKYFPNKLAKIVNNQQLSHEDEILVKEIVDSKPFHWNGCVLWSEKKICKTEFSPNSCFSRVLPSGNVIVVSHHEGPDTYTIIPVNKFKQLHEKTIKLEETFKNELKEEYTQKLTSFINSKI